MTSLPHTASVGFLGGSFDPPHLGHLNLALCLMEAHQLEEVWFCPTWMNPFRQEEKKASAIHRLNMTALAIADIPRFRLLDFECEKGDVSYTIDTLRHLVQQEQTRSHPRQIRLLLGADSAQSLHLWREPEAIVQIAPPLVGLRSGYSLSAIPTPFLTLLEQGRTEIPQMDISSTAIRKRLGEGLYCGHLVPAKVMDYISTHALY